MLHPDTKQIAEELTGYIPFSEEEADDQFQAEINYTPELYSFEDEDTHPTTGSVYRKGFTLMCYWVPETTEDSLEGWYPVPTNGEVEEWALGSTAFTPYGDEVEPDHPDSWLSILALI